MPPPIKDITGTQSGLLTALQFYGIVEGVTYWWCDCQCGDVVLVRAGDLQNERTKSCGCWRREQARQTISEKNKRRTGKAHHNYLGGKNNPGSVAWFNNKVRHINRKAQEKGEPELDLNTLQIKLKYEQHDGTCEKCGIGREYLNKALAIDHCHQTGAFRGFLCGGCNTGLGLLGDTVEGLLEAINYLERKGS